MSYPKLVEKYASKLRQRFTKPTDKRNAAALLEIIEAALAEKEREADELFEKSVQTMARLDAAEEKAKSIHGRLSYAIRELDKHKGHSPSRVEKPSAIIMSPYQYRKVCDGYSPSGEGPKTYGGYPIYLATGFYGPAVVTQAALDGLSRNAPELNLRRP